MIDYETSGARGGDFALGHDHAGSFLDRLFEELAAIAYLTANGNEKTIPLHSPRVIRDAFHLAIKRPDDPMGRDGAGEYFKLHIKFRLLLNAATQLLKPHDLPQSVWSIRDAAQDRGTGLPSRRCGQKSDQQPGLRNSAPAWR